ncbi:FkbM family methyltransferase [Luteolibacter yonseiensis]|uniref:FkbM family methyltransferase n=1 Tax=Luteolibacter yonseiensis TaxID=1144680 RepID=A0A934R321_9BACT|nr:FkbM family methyltransferase [Luteolibacter yonseiensis]MBK1814390.1 FkbM family methyltransferase [Luteolibacter yonseiensis]
MFDILWVKREYDSPLYGWLWSLTNKTYRTEGLEFGLPFQFMPMGFRSRFFFDCYELPERKLIRRHLAKDDRVLELGACVGVVSCMTNRLLSDPGAHLVVEANPRLIPILESNRATNACKFMIEHCLVSKTMDGTFFLQDFIVSGSANLATGKEVSVPVYSNDDLCAKHDFRPNVLIMDIEGGEIDFVSENEHRLPDFRLLIIEMHPFIVGADRIESCRSALRRMGFALKETEGLVEAWINERATASGTGRI